MLKCTKEYKDGFIGYRIFEGDKMVAFNISDIDYPKKSAIKMYENKGFLFR